MLIRAWYSLVKRTCSLHIRHHKFPRPFHEKTLFLGVRKGILIKLFIKATIPMVWLRVVYALFGSLASLKIIPLVAPGILSTFFSIDSYHALKTSLNHRDQTEVSSLKDFSKNPYTFTYFCHHTAIYSFSNWFICFDFGYFIYSKDFFAFCKGFSTFHIDRGIIKLIAWTSSFLEERLDFEITWFIWNTNNPTMSPRWPKNIRLYLKRLLLIQNAWRMNLT